jgi:type IV pilus assembly protein PilF
MKQCSRVVMLLLASLLFGGCASGGSGSTATEDIGVTDANATNDEQAAVVLTQLGVGYLRQGNYEAAMNRLKRALGRDSDYAPAHSAIAVLYEQLGKEEDAGDHYRRAARLAPKDPGILNNYGRYLCQQKKYRDAERSFAKALDDPLYPERELLYANAGECALKQKQYDKAETWLRKALEINGRISSALVGMAMLMAEKQNYMSARAYLERYASAAPHTPATLGLGMRVEQALGDEQAVANYRMKLLNDFPNAPEAQSLNE